MFDGVVEFFGGSLAYFIFTPLPATLILDFTAKKSLTALGEGARESS